MYVYGYKGNPTPFNLEKVGNRSGARSRPVPRTLLVAIESAQHINTHNTCASLEWFHLVPWKPHIH